MLTILLIAMVIGVIPAAIASSKGENFAVWYIYGVALFIVALIHSLVLPPMTQATQDARALEGGELRRCPACAELVRREAVVCRFCGRDLPVLATQPAPSTQITWQETALPARDAAVRKEPDANRWLGPGGLVILLVSVVALLTLYFTFLGPQTNSNLSPETNSTPMTQVLPGPEPLFTRYCPAVLQAAKRQNPALSHHLLANGEAQRGADGQVRCNAIHGDHQIGIAFIVTCGEARTECVSVTGTEISADAPPT